MEIDGAPGIAVEAGATILVDRDAMVAAAEVDGLFLAGIDAMRDDG